MAIIKIGTTWYNGEERQIFLIQGVAARDAEDAPVNGSSHAKVSVAVAEDASGATTFVQLNGWRHRADDVIKIQKLDSVLAIGVLKAREYNDRKYYDLDADYVSISGSGLNLLPFDVHGNPPELPDFDDLGAGEDFPL